MLASACHRGPDDTPPGPPLLQGLQKLDADLKIGDVGPHVRTVHDYLTTYGYYPNADLAVQFPAWRPIANEPKDPNVFDQQTADAVRQLQVHYGLSPTGIVDGPTRAAMVTPRCGIPDGIARLDSSDKFSYGNVRWLQVIPTQVLGSSLPANVTLAQLVDATNQAAFTWEGATFLEINVSSGGGAVGAGGSGGAGAGAGGASGTFYSNRVVIQFGAVDGPGNKLAQTSPSGANEVVTLDSSETWSTGTPRRRGPVRERSHGELDLPRRLRQSLPRDACVDAGLRWRVAQSRAQSAARTGSVSGSCQSFCSPSAARGPAIEPTRCIDGSASRPQSIAASALAVQTR